MVGDTESVGYTDMTGGSRVTFATGMAVIEAARDVVRQLRERAAKLWDCDPAQVACDEGRCVPAEASGLAKEPLSVADIARKMRRAPAARSSARRQLTARGAGPGFATHIVRRRGRSRDRHAWT